MKLSRVCLPAFLVLAAMPLGGCASSGGSSEFADIEYLVGGDPQGLVQQPMLIIHVDRQAAATLEPVSFLTDDNISGWDYAGLNELVLVDRGVCQYYQNQKLARSYPLGGEQSYGTRIEWLKLLPEQHAFLVGRSVQHGHEIHKIDLATGEDKIFSLPPSADFLIDSKPMRDGAVGPLVFLARPINLPNGEFQALSRIYLLNPGDLTVQRTVDVAGVQMVRLLSFGPQPNTVLAYAMLANASGKLSTVNLFDSDAPRAFISVDLSTGLYTKIMDDTLPGWYDPHRHFAVIARRFVIMNRVKAAPRVLDRGSIYYASHPFLIDLQKNAWSEITFPFSLAAKANDYVPVYEGDAGVGSDPINQDELTLPR